MAKEDAISVDACLKSYKYVCYVCFITVWCQLGKIQNPLDEKIEKNLQDARLTIDILLFRLIMLMG